MKIFTYIALIVLIVIGYKSTNAQFFEMLKNEVKKQKLLGDDDLPFSKDEAAKAIKEALVKGVSKGTKVISKKNGFYKNPEIKIPFPEDDEPPYQK